LDILNVYILEWGITANQAKFSTMLKRGQTTYLWLYPVTDLRIGHAPPFWGPRATLSYDDKTLTKNLRTAQSTIHSLDTELIYAVKLFMPITSQFTLKRAEMQMSTLDSYQYGNNTTILCIWAWERCRPSL